jgi:hypothetical protein
VILVILAVVAVIILIVMCCTALWAAWVEWRPEFGYRARVREIWRKQDEYRKERGR